MTTSLGFIGSFDAAAEDWIVYAERVEHYFLENGIVDLPRSDLSYSQSVALLPTSSLDPSLPN